MRKIEQGIVDLYDEIENGYYNKVVSMFTPEGVESTQKSADEMIHELNILLNAL